MSLINKAIESLFNGVSQQPAQLRLSSQAEASENYYPTIATGLNKRPATRHKAKLSTSTDTAAYTSIINRDLSERYVLLIRNGALEVFDAITGAQKTVTAPSGVAYLASSNPAADFSTVTVADYTFVVNKSKTVAYGSTTAGGSLTGSVQVFSDLPATNTDGNIYYISSQPGSAGKGYYVKFSSANNAYIECPAPGIFTELDPLTMPHKLVRNSDGTFTFAPLTWVPRKIGDYASNPWPSFVGRKINDTFFYRNRLGFLSDENVILSTSGDYFNFFAKTATAVTDADPIDLAVANTKVSILRFAVPFNKVLLLFADQTQFQLTANDVLTPKSVKAEPVTEFMCSQACRPVGAGQQLFFASNKPNSTAMREYFVQQDSFTNDAADITAHCPSYIPTGIFHLAVSTTEDTLMALTTTERNAMYVYKYYWGAQEKVQSAWFKFIFDPTDVLLGCAFVGSVAYIVVKRPDGIHLEEMAMQAADTDVGLPFPVLLDRKVFLTGTYDAGANITSWTLPWTPVGDVEMVLGESYGSRAGSSSGLTKGAGTVVSFPGDYSSGPVYIGVRYKGRYRFSEQYIKDANKLPIASAVLKMRRMMVTYAGTGYFRVEVTPPGRETNTYLFTGKTLGVAGVRLGYPALSSGSFRFPVMSSTKGVIIELINDSPFPSAFQSAEWEGEMVLQAKRL